MSDRLNSNLKRRAASWAGQLTKLAKSYAPMHIRPAISSHVELKGDGEYIIRITADRYMPLEPRNSIPNDTRAQEFGSGLNARRGPQETYVIKPIPPHKYLAFPWEVFDQMVQNGADAKFLANLTGKFRGFAEIPAEDGRDRYLFSHVDHPGIEAANGGEGYIAPAMKDLKEHAKENLTEDIRKAITGDLRESFGRKR